MFLWCIVLCAFPITHLSVIAYSQDIYKGEIVLSYEILFEKKEEDRFIICDYILNIYPVKNVTIPTIGHIFKKPSAYWS